MTSPRDKVAHLISSGRVSAREGQLLLDALKPTRSAWLRRWLFDPFPQLSAKHGAVAIAISVALQIIGSRLGVRYDGALDVHVASAPSWGVTLLEIVVDLGLSASIAWAVALGLSARPRWIDVLVVTAVSRLPLILSGIPLCFLLPDPETLRLQALSGELHPVYILVSLLVLPAVVWSFVLWFRGYRTATGLTGGRLWGAFLGGLLVAEILTKVVLVWSPL